MGVRLLVGVLGSFLACLWATPTLHGQCGIETAQLTADDGIPSDRFGESVALSGDTVVVGASFVNAQAGSAYVYRRVGGIWFQEQELSRADGAAGDYFGASVAISGNLIVVGAPGDDDSGTGSGSAYVYRFTGTSWDPEQKLAASDGSTQDVFGGSVSAHGLRVLIGARGDDGGGGPESGSAYLFHYDGVQWTDEQKLVAVSGNAFDFFGSAVSLAADVLVIGASHRDQDGPYSGSAHVFRRVADTWIQEQELTASDATGGDRFGVAVAISDDAIVVGAHLDDHSGGLESGSAYVFRDTGGSWSEEQKLTASDAAGGDRFGSAVSISGDMALVGAHLDDDAGEESGSAYAYRYAAGNWVQEPKLTAGDEESGDRFGAAVSIDADVLVVGAAANDQTGEGTGAAYIFSFDCGFVRGDCNFDHDTNISDAIFMLDAMFGAVQSTCDDACDANDDGLLDIADPILTLSHLFSFGPGPSAPYPDCGSDPTTDALGCTEQVCQ